ncbi:MAG TPA: folate-binding protein [Methylophilaceae bacterium]|nr:folate-binding protein [Methylophilaceae bacterium]
MTLVQWQTELTAQGAHITNQTVENFSNAAQELEATKQSNIVCDLSHLGLISLHGEDAITFLQGQVTNDVKQLDSNQAHLSGYCTAKGRLLALFLAFSYQSQIYLQLPRSLLTPITKRLKMYVLRSKVNIDDMTDFKIQLGVSGPDAETILSKLFSSIPVNNFQHISTEQTTILKLPSVNNLARYQLITSIKNASTLWHSLKSSCQPVGKSCWDWLEINAGIPEVVPETQEQFVPQMLNLDLLNGINFKKGCYTGQEIVARTHYLGSVKRRTFLAELTTSDLPKAGEKLLDQNKNEVGQIVRLVPNNNAGVDMLVELRIDAQQTGTIYWQDKLLSFKELPYSLV